MKKIFLGITLMSMLGCGSGDSSGTASDTSVNAGARGNSDGINTTGTDTAHMDTSLGRIQTDSAK